MKGQQEIVSAVLISGILIGVVGSVYFWGVPLIQKNQDISTLKSAEDFMRSLNDKIKFVANNGGRDRLRLDVPGIIEFFPAGGSDARIELTVDTKGTIYAAEAEIPLSRNECSRTSGTFGVHDSSVLCVRSKKLGENDYTTIYTLRYIQLNVLQSGAPARSFLLNMQGPGNSGGQNKFVVFDNTGSTEQGTVVKTNVRIDIE